MKKLTEQELYYYHKNLRREKRAARWKKFRETVPKVLGFSIFIAFIGTFTVMFVCYGIFTFGMWLARTELNERITEVSGDLIKRGLDAYQQNVSYEIQHNYVHKDEMPPTTRVYYYTNIFYQPAPNIPNILPPPPVPMKTYPIYRMEDNGIFMTNIIITNANFIR